MNRITRNLATICRIERLIARRRFSIVQNQAILITLAGVNIALAGLLALRAGRMNVEDEIAPAVELRDLAIADLEAEVEDVAKKAHDIINSLKGLHNDPFESLTALILPLVTAVLKGLNQRASI